jgi:hypothetical protein
MRRVAIPCILLLVVLSGLLLLLDIEEPEGVAPRAGRPSNGLPGATETSSPGAAPDDDASATTVISGMFWQDGGAPVPGLVAHLETSDGRIVRKLVSARNGAYELPIEDLGRAGAGARLSVNPARGNDRFQAFRFRLPTDRPRLDVYVRRSGPGERFDLEIELVGLRSEDDGGGGVHVWLQNPKGVTGRWALEPNLSRVIIPDCPEDVYAVGATQDDLVAHAAPTRIGRAESPLRLVLGKGAWLVGRVVTADASPAAGANLSLVFDAAVGRRLRGQYVYDVATSGNHHARWLATADRDGLFRIGGLFPARYTLGVAHPAGTARVEIGVPSLGTEVPVPDLVLESRTGCIVANVELPREARESRGNLRLLVIGYAHGAQREVALTADRSRFEVRDLPPDDYAVLAIGVEVDLKTRARFESIVSEYGLVTVRPDGHHTVTLGPSP